MQVAPAQTMEHTRMLTTRPDRVLTGSAIHMAAGLLVCCVFVYHPVVAAPQPPATPASQTSGAKTELEKMSAQPAKPTYPQTIAGAKQAYKDSNYQDALKILVKLEGDYAGQVEYDYLLGRCALESKQFTVAAGAFIRALTVDPDFAAARFELARTYYSKGVALLARGPFEQARSEFKLVAAMNPPAALKASIDQYQANIDKYLKVRETEYRLFAEMTAGYDSNIGGFSEDDSFTYYDYGTMSQRSFDIENDRDREDSGFSQAQAGAGIDWPLFSNNFEVFGNLMFGGRSYASNHGYDHAWSEVQFGLRHYGESNKKTFRFRFRSTDLTDSGERYHEQGETMFKLSFKHSETQAISFWLLGGNSDYQAHGTYVFSVNYNRQGVEFTQLSQAKRQSSIQVLLLSGRDDPHDCGDQTMYCPDAYTRDIKGFRVAWGANIFDSSRFYTSLFFEDSRYDREFFYQKRRDKRTEFFMATNTHFSDNWYFRPELHYTDIDSSVDLYDMERWLVSMTIGWGI